jgi:hypothetical protein
LNIALASLLAEALAVPPVAEAAAPLPVLVLEALSPPAYAATGRANTAAISHFAFILISFVSSRV